MDRVNILEQVQRAELESALKSRLHSRMIPFEAYYMADGSAVIIITLRSDRFSVSVPYVISSEPDGTFLASTPSKFFNTTSVNDAVSQIILDVRRIEVRYHKWKK